MARPVHALILAALSFGGTAGAQDTATPAKKLDVGSPAPRRPGQRPMGPEFGNVRRALEALTPEQRQRFVENLKRWNNLSPEEKKALADREGVRRKKIAEEIDLAINDAGLNLEGDRRALFARRYVEERRKVEEQLRKEMEEKRQPMVKEFVARLKEEFSSGSTAPK